jgi:hypothetical protein
LTFAKSKQIYCRKAGRFFGMAALWLGRSKQ